MTILLGISRSHFQNKRKTSVFLIVTPYAPRDKYRRVRGNCCLYHWVIRLSWRWSSLPLYCWYICTGWYGVTLSWTVIFNPVTLESQVWQSEQTVLHFMPIHCWLLLFLVGGLKLLRPRGPCVKKCSNMCPSLSWNS
jgi:hypothetical protein